MTKYNAHAQVREKKTTRRRRKKREERQRQSGAAMPGMRILIIQRRPSTKRNSFKEKERKKEKKEEWEKRPRTDRWSSPVRARTGSVCCRRASKKVLNPVDPRDSRLLLFLFLSLVPAFSDHSRVSLFYFSKMKCYSSDWVVVAS